MTARMCAHVRDVPPVRGGGAAGRGGAVSTAAPATRGAHNKAPMEGAVPYCDGYFRCVHPECNAFGRGGRGYLRARDARPHCRNPREHFFLLDLPGMQMGCVITHTVRRNAPRSRPLGPVF